MFLTLPPAPFHISIDARKPQTVVPRELFGVFFEEINHAGEGGVYAELLRNGGFAVPPRQQEAAMEGWRIDGGLDAARGFDAHEPLNTAHPFSFSLQRDQKPVTLVNEGFWGIPVQKGARYALELWVRTTTPIRVDLTNGTSASFPSTDRKWQRFGANLAGLNSDPKSELRLSPEGSGTMEVAFASLKPEATWKGHGLRPDLAERVAAMRPGFFRFPGGCYIEGNSLAGNAWNWKATLGSPETRPGTDKTYWGYPSGNGLGFHEYLQFCEDLGAKPMYVANVGLSHSDMATLDGAGPESMSRYVQDALDAIEYANGPAKSKWGAMRAKAGHPKPFGLRYVEIGNEAGYDWSFGGPAAYAPRFRRMAESIRARHPEIVVIANNPLRDGGPQSYDLVSEHYYESSNWFWRDMTRYDSYDRKQPGIYVGEYAVTKGAGRGNLAAALGEAAFMTGMERNADVVRMASYAPLLENVNARQWNPNAIVFDNHQSYGTPSYWVQTMFAQNRIVRVLSSQADAPAATPPALSGNIGLQTWKTQAEFKDVRIETEPAQGSVDVTTPDPTGTWTSKDGLIAQGDLGENRQYIFAGHELTGVRRATLVLRARKLGGAEGFILMLGGNADADRLQWNLGGWGNTRHAFQFGGTELPSSIQLTDATRIQTDRWYDIRLEREGDRVRGYLDGKLIQEATIPTAPDFVTIAGRAENGDLLLRVVNGAAESRDAEIAVDGFRPRSGTAIVLTGAPSEENSFESPEKIAPRAANLEGVGPRFLYTAPPIR